MENKTADAVSGAVASTIRLVWKYTCEAAVAAWGLLRELLTNRIVLAWLIFGTVVAVLVLSYGIGEYEEPEFDRELSEYDMGFDTSEYEAYMRAYREEQERNAQMYRDKYGRAAFNVFETVVAKIQLAFGMLPTIRGEFTAPGTNISGGRCDNETKFKDGGNCVAIKLPDPITWTISSPDDGVGGLPDDISRKLIDKQNVQVKYKYHSGVAKLDFAGIDHSVGNFLTVHEDGNTITLASI